MTNEDRDYLCSKALETIENYSALHEAPWLYNYFRTVIEHKEEFETFDLDLTEWIGEGGFSYLNPKVVSLFYGVNIGLGTGMGFDYFIRGAATAASLINPNQLPGLTVWLNAQHEAMFESEMFPAVNEKFLQDYVDILTTTLMQEETTTWRPFLSFVSGVYWMLAQIRLDATDSIVKEVREILLDRARKGLIEVF